MEAKSVQSVVDSIHALQCSKRSVFPAPARPCPWWRDLHPRDPTPRKAPLVVTYCAVGMSLFGSTQNLHTGVTQGL